MKNSLKAVLFDLDGTLIDFHHEHLFSQTEILLEALEHRHITRAHLEESFSAFDYFSFIEASERDHFIERFWENFDWNGFPKPKPLATTLSTLEALKINGIRTGIVTSRFMPVEKLREDLAHTGMLEYFCHVATRPGDHIHWTDKRQMIREACEVLGFEPRQVAMVGDIPTDVTSAKDVGVGWALAVLSGGIRREVLEQAEPFRVLDDIGALPSLIWPETGAKGTSN